MIVDYVARATTIIFCHLLTYEENPKNLLSLLNLEFIVNSLNKFASQDLNIEILLSSHDPTSLKLPKKDVYH